MGIDKKVIWVYNKGKEFKNNFKYMARPRKYEGEATVKFRIAVKDKIKYKKICEIKSKTMQDDFNEHLNKTINE